jgi:competence protein CoiA
MKFALVNGNEVEATKGAKGLCRSCGSELVAKCGEDRVNHWAHKGRRTCDPWWENETDWHRSWKNNFPQEWQEVIHTDEVSGEKHIADVKTDSDWVLEFQHSHIKPEERRSRNSFYPKLVWVIDGTRRQRDKPNFYRILEEFAIRSDEPRFKRILGPDDCTLIKEWHESNALVFLDFQDEDDTKQPILWFLFPRITISEAYLWPISRDKFIELHNNNKFDELVEKAISPFVKKLINDEKIKDEIEESRRRERSLRMDWLRVGGRGRL